jgi:hypothetical protein
VTLSGLDVLIYTITFLVPGYVLHSTLAALASHKPVESDLAFLRFLTLGAVHNAPWAALFYLLFRPHLDSRDEAQAYFRDHAPMVSVIWLAVVLLSPFLAGIAYVHLRRAGMAAWAWKTLRLKPLDPTATAWDFGFERGWRDLYVGVTLTDGTVVYGRFGARSNASSGVAGRDMHIEEVWEVDEADGHWYLSPDATSVTITGDSIQSVTFWGTARD